MVGDGKYSGCESPSGRRELARRVEGKVAPITGGGRGQGRAPALALGGGGADIAICDDATGSDPATPYGLAVADGSAHAGINVKL